MPHLSSYLALAFLWLLYFSVHSLLAANRVKNALGFLGNGYRLVYSTVAIFGLVGVLLYMVLIPPEWLWASGDANRYFGMLLATFGFFVIRLGFKQYRTKAFLGLAQIKGEKDDDTFKRSGILNRIRHPLYSGTMLLIWGLVVFAPHWAHLVSAICLQLYLFVGTWLEEKKLIAAFGDRYRTYQQEVPMFIPRIRRNEN